MDYLIWQAEHVGRTASLLAPAPVRKSYQLNRGISRLADWPGNVVCEMNPDYPEDGELIDNMHATGLLVVSAALRARVLDAGATDVEFLPVTIVDHTGTVAGADYSIVNPIGVVDCIDMDASKVEWNSINRDLIDDFESMVLKDGFVSERQIFRPKHHPFVILVASPLASDLIAAGLTGLRLREPQEYTGH